MKVLWLGSARYTKPLSETVRAKFRLLDPLGELRVIGFSTDWRFRRFREYARFYLLPVLPGPPVRYVEHLLLGGFLTFWLVLRGRADVVVTQSPYSGAVAALARRAARLFGRDPVLIVETHGDYREALFMQRAVRLPGVYRRIMQAAARYALREADLVRAISRSTEARLREEAPGTPIELFPSWTDMTAFVAAGARRPPPTEDVVYAGVLTPLKGLDHLVRAFAMVADEAPAARLRLIGEPIDPAFHRRLRELVVESGLEGRVEMPGLVSQTELARAMAGARVFVLPSLTEGLGRVVFEAMATGTPVIGSAVGGIPEIVEEGRTGYLVPPEDVPALAERIRTLLREPDRARRMGEEGRRFATGFFGPDQYRDGYARLFDRASAMIASRR